MVKQLYDPHMFNYMWESIVPDDNFIVGTYYLEDTVDAVDADSLMISRNSFFSGGLKASQHLFGG